MYRDRANWTAYNAGVDGRECEGSAWLGALHEPLPSGGTVDVFKSWATRRRADPGRILLERRFKHPLITPRADPRPPARLRRLQGRHGLYFSGQYTTGTDLQESAVYSAMQVARALAPASPTLAVAGRAAGGARARRDLLRPLISRRPAGLAFTVICTVPLLGPVVASPA